MASIFISHAREDSAAARDVKAWLQRQRFEQVFLDFDKVSGLEIGDDWEHRLYAALHR